MFSLFNHSPLFRVMKLLCVTECKARDATAVSRGAWPLIRAAGHGRVVITDRFFGRTTVAFRIPILFLTVTYVDGMSCRNSMLFQNVFRFLLFLIAAALDFDALTFSSRRLYKDFLLCFALILFLIC